MSARQGEERETDMRVQMTVTIDVNDDEWAAEYGLEPNQIADDVHTYFHTHMLGSYVVSNGIVTDIRVASK